MSNAPRPGQRGAPCAGHDHPGCGEYGRSPLVKTRLHLNKDSACGFSTLLHCVLTCFPYVRFMDLGCYFFK